ncbi:MAG: BON domain-containing protein [Gammaproteobacteria bacterium]
MTRLLTPLLLISSIALTGCVPLVVGAGAAGGGYVAHDRRTVGTQIDDRALAVKVGKQINANRDIDEFGHINVYSYNARVLITGEVPTEALREFAGKAATSTPGVRSVYNELQVSAPSSFMSRSSDVVISGKVKAALFSVKLEDFDPTRVYVTTERGEVYLMGLVRRVEAEAATDVVRRVSGVQRVVKIFEYLD